MRTSKPRPGAVAATSKTTAFFQKTKNLALPEDIAKRLDNFLEQYQCTTEELSMIWEMLTVNKDVFKDMAIPNTQGSVAAIERALQDKRRTPKASSAVAGLRQPLTAATLSSITPVTKKRGAAEGISPVAAQPKTARVAEKTKMAITNDSLGLLAAGGEARGTNVTLLAPVFGEHLRAYMYARLDAVAENARNELVEFGKALMSEAGKLEVPKGSEDADIVFDPVGAPVHGRNVLVLGRVVCDAASGKLNTKALLLEGTNGVRVSLDVDPFAGRYSVFPGQHLVVEGSCATGTTVQVERLYDGSVLAAPSTQRPCAPAKIWLACGPFTDANTLDYAPLAALLSECREHKPDVLVLVGPLIDAEHPLIKTGSFRLEGGDYTFEDGYAICLKQICAQLGPDSRTRVVVVPSADDVTSVSMALPQAPMTLPLDLEPEERARFTMLPNPCVFQVGGEHGPVVGLGNVDALFHFMDEGSPYQGLNSEGLQRLCNHMLLQRSFYPQAPAHPEACVDMTQRAALRLPAVDILVTPSRLARFASAAHNVLCINPGKSMPAKTSATFCMLDVHEGEQPLADKTRVEFRTVDF